MAEEDLRDQAPQEDEDKREPKLFNQDARDAVEAAYDALAGDEQPPVEAPPVEDKPADKGVDVTEMKPVETAPVDEWKPEFRDHRTAEESYRNARLKMQQATEEAARLKRRLEEVEAQAYKPPVFEQPQAQAPPPLDKDALEAEFFKDPIGFQLAMNEAMARHAVEQAERNITTKEQQSRSVRMQQMMTEKLQHHFDTTYPELKEVETLATSYTDQVRNDEAFMRPLLESITKAPPEQRARRMFEVSKVVMDEGVKRLKGRLPEIIRPLGFSGPGEPIKERLTGGAPPVVPGGSTGGPVVRPETPQPETPTEYMRERLNRQQRSMSGVGRWRATR